MSTVSVGRQKTQLQVSFCCLLVVTLLVLQPCASSIFLQGNRNSFFGEPDHSSANGTLGLSYDYHTINENLIPNLQLIFAKLKALASTLLR
jgi:hypothetical protein